MEHEHMLRRSLGEDVDLRLDLAPDLGAVRADPGRISQVILNLVFNARAAMPLGGKLVIRTHNGADASRPVDDRSDGAPGPSVCVTVTDTGCGMSQATMTRVFEPFFTTKEKGKGTGLGLSTAYGIVKQAGGTISVVSLEGQGTTFCVSLPATDDPIAAKEPPTADAPRLGRDETILVVDDEESIVGAASRILAESGYRVMGAQSAAEALRAAAAHRGPIDLLVTDVIMPLQSGRELAGHLARERPGLKVLYISGYSDNIISRHGILDDGVHLLPKPFTPEQLLVRVRKLLDADPVPAWHEAPPPRNHDPLIDPL
jgi:CheY-like chemotaxis protein